MIEKVFTTLFACLIMFVSNAHAVLISTNIGTFSNPNVLDFESAPLGPIGGSDPLFTSFGVSFVTDTASDFNDTFGVRTNSSRALWADLNGLKIVDPGATGLANQNSYSVTFASPQTKIGIGVHDSAGDFDFEVFSGIPSVGTISVPNGSADLVMFYLDSTTPFDRITVTQSGGLTPGFAIDNITLESIPEPTALALAGLGLLGIGCCRRKRM